MAILMAEVSELSMALDRWLKAQRLTPASLARLAGVSRKSIYNVIDGTPVTSETLRKIARGLARDPHTEAFDSEVYKMVWRDFARASGYPEPADEPPTAGDLDANVRALIPNRTRAALMAEFVRAYPNMTPDQKRLVDALIDGIVTLGDR